MRLARAWSILFGRLHSYDEIIAAMDPWVLCNAVGAENRSTGFSYGYYAWLEVSRKNWLRKVKVALPGVPGARVEMALRRFVLENQAKDYQTVLHEENMKRGKQTWVVRNGEIVKL